MCKSTIASSCCLFVCFEEGFASPSTDFRIFGDLLLDWWKKVREKSRECHNHKPQPFPDPKRKRKPTNLNKHKPNKRTKSTKISSLFPKRGNRNTKRTEKHKNKMTHGKIHKKSPRRINHKATKSKTNTGITALERSVEQTTVGFKALLQLANFTLGPDATLNTEIHKNSVRIKAPNSVNATLTKLRTLEKKIIPIDLTSGISIACLQAYIVFWNYEHWISCPVTYSNVSLQSVFLCFNSYLWWQQHRILFMWS